LYIINHQSSATSSTSMTCCHKSKGAENTVELRQPTALTALLLHPSSDPAPRETPFPSVIGFRVVSACCLCKQGRVQTPLKHRSMGIPDAMCDDEDDDDDDDDDDAVSSRLDTRSRRGERGNRSTTASRSLKGCSQPAIQPYNMSCYS
jgi:hypothetical protein